MPIYGIETPAATRIVQDLAPEEGIGPLRKVPFDQLQPGTYEVSDKVPRDLCPNLDFGCPALTSVFKEYSRRITLAVTDPSLPKIQRLPNGQAFLIIEDWQTDLRKVTFRILWDDPDTQERKTFEKHIYIHRHHGGE